MIWYFVVGAGCFLLGAFVGWRIGVSLESAGWIIASEYRKQADEMMDRLTELEQKMFDGGG
jgi:hypothetical protein